LIFQQQQQQLQMFWTYQHQEIEQVNDFKNHQLPLARIKKIMKADKDVRVRINRFSVLQLKKKKKKTKRVNPRPGSLTQPDYKRVINGSIRL
jgi:hypothetical protein